MADANYANFSKRMSAIEKRHRRMSRGYVQLVERDGILVPKARRTARRKFPLRGLALFLALFLVFKGFLMVQLGDATYAERVSKLNSGTAIEQVGAWVMQADPISLWISQQVKSWM